MKAITAVAVVALGCITVGALSSCGGAKEQVSSASHLDFNRDIRPILSQNCFRCHGPDAETRKAGLRLDLPAPAYGVLPKSPGRHAVVPGKPDESELVRRVTSKDPDERMPHDLAPLSSTQIATLVAWIRQGAPYEQQWSLIPPKKVDPPSSQFDSARAVNVIDRFVFARLAKAGLAPAQEADRATLIRRVSLTLTGLPPTLAEVDTFVKDSSPNAYEKVVDRLLASPAYGERMAGMWMDLARWSDSDGYLDDNHDRLLWPWRDWVIQAFNSNMPYDQFGTWQLAGDLLPHPTRDQLLATAFLRLGQRTTENGALNEQFRVEAVVDKTNTVGTAFLGLTVGCAACHDHKYDPISQKDYYSFSGFFNSDDEPGVYAPGYTGLQGGPTLPWPTAQQQQQMTQIKAALEQRTADYAQALAEASHAARPKVTAMLGASGTPGIVKTSLTTSTGHGPVQAASLVRESLNKAMAAYYPFDSVETIPPKAYPTLRRPRQPLPPAALMISLTKRPFPGGAPPAAGSKGKVDKAKLPAAFARAVGSPSPGGYTLKYMEFSPSGMPGVGPAVIQQPKLGPGVKGQALYFTETNKGYFARNVGYYDRTQQFSFDFWFYPDQAYKDDVPIFTHCNVQGADTWQSGVAGYEMDLSQQHLVFYMAHVRPHNMLAVSVKDSLPLKQWSHIALTYDGSSKAGGLHIYINGKLAAVDVIRDNLTETILPVGNNGLTMEEFVGLAFGTRFREKAPVGSGLDEFRVFDRALTPLEVSYLNEGNRALADGNNGGAAVGAQLTNLVAIGDPRVVSARHALDEVRAQQNQLASSIPEVLIEGVTPTPQPPHLLNRGLYDQPREQLPVRGLEQVFRWNAQLPSNRLGLAKWLFDPNNPLTARVFVNDLWQTNFGTGLVKTAADFGSQGAMPTHPELLDWLAVDFIDSGWDIKRLEKMVVMSATYRQSSDATQAVLTRDPENALLARGPRFRMTDRMIRDSALADAGLLVRTIGGPSVHPYQPDGIWDPAITFYTYPQPDQLPPDELHRRTLYTFVKRNAMNPQLQLLDSADPTVSIARLSVSNTPMQSLLLLNSPQYEEAYRLMATHALEATGKIGVDPTAQLTQVFRLARQQSPSATQLTVLRSYYDQRIQHYKSDPAAGASLMKVGVASAPDGSLDRIQLAALTNVAALIMNTPDSYFVR